MCLSNLKFDSGKQHGDELRLLQTPKALREETNRSVVVKRKLETWFGNEFFSKLIKFVIGLLEVKDFCFGF